MDFKLEAGQGIMLVGRIRQWLRPRLPASGASEGEGGSLDQVFVSRMLQEAHARNCATEQFGSLPRAAWPLGMGGEGWDFMLS